MSITIAGQNRILLDRYLESILLRFGDNKYNLAETTEALAQAFVQMTRGEADFLDHIRGVVEAGDDA